MRQLLLTLVFICSFSIISSAQMIPPKFGKGFRVLGVDSSFYLKFGFRFQNLATGEWSLAEDQLSGAEGFESAFLVRRSRFKFDGWALSPKIVYKFELGLTNRDIGSGNTTEYRNAPRLILDASVAWNFYENFIIQFGQRKLPGNRERVVSSGNLQFVDRSRLNSRYNIDRDMGFQLKHKLNLGKAVVKSTFALSQGEGRNVTEGNFGGSDYTFHLDILPMGAFANKSDYVGADIARTPTPKLGIGLAYNMNRNAVRERGQLGSFIQDSDGNYVGKNLNTFFADLMFKYQGLSVMMEYANKQTDDDIPFVFDDADGDLIGTFYTGTGINLQAGYMLKSDYEVAYRFTDINPNAGVSYDETHHTIGLSKYIVGHKLKIQTDVSIVEKEGRDDALVVRAQMDIHF